ncbi:hypothetical protein M622_01590 [Thauera terpenica 58Eu]|uniref:Uncharacterized protein n=1 Tax=Thauera terpenica 58Eu TaxID=1348657 RepID=S9ZQT4_9RHOO|nr:hypothetical protein [Thauera terpenica]EPZ15887.1 hypothetical protein M622_01590 [Thauera terpenica 58Eu]
MLFKEMLMFRRLSVCALLWAVSLCGVSTTTAWAQSYERDALPMLPELFGVVQSVSLAPPAMVIDGVRYSVSNRVLLIADRRPESVVFSQIGTQLVGKAVSFGWRDEAAESRSINVILLDTLMDTNQGERAKGPAR